ncbi:MAG: hypothetical protein ABIN67_16205 [Ferruginibacter sp.]
MQQTISKTADKDFHAVDYMRQVREKLSAQYQADKQKYLERAREAMAAFKLRQINASR